MKPPKLPEPTIVDGRRLYTAGDMREFWKAGVEYGMQFEPYTPAEPTEAGKYTSAVQDLFSKFGMK